MSTTLDADLVNVFGEMETPGTKPLTDEADNRDKAKIFIESDAILYLWKERWYNFFFVVFLKVVTMLIILMTHLMTPLDAWMHDDDYPILFGNSSWNTS